VAEDSVGTHRQQRRHPAALLGHRGVPDVEDTAGDPMQRARGHSVRDGALGEPKLGQLGGGDHPELARGEAREPFVAT
jgi:hypothetical protein